MVLVGPSGCGKTTALRIVAGLEEISAGTLSIAGRVVNEVSPKERDIAMVFQNYALYPHMTAYETMAFALKLRKMPRAEIDRRVRDAATMLGIQELLGRTPRQLSGGQRQRVAVGRALVRHPKVFLFDEPLSNLDAKLRVQMRREIARLHRELRTTMIYVTHDQVEAMTLGDRIVVMNAGRVQQVDTPLALYERPRNTFVATFVGSPAMNLLRGDLVRDGTLRFRARGGAFMLALPPAAERALADRAGQPVILGIRPEDVRLSEHDTPRSGDEARFRLELAEPLGSELLLHATAGQEEVTARVSPQEPPSVGSELLLAFDRSRMHLFEAESGERIELSET